MTRRPALRPADRDEWLRVARAAPEATYFHTPHWSEVAEAEGGWVDVTVSASLADGATAVFPLVALRRRRLRRLAATRSSFSGCYGGPIAERRLTEPERVALYEAVARRHLTELRVTLPPGATAPAAGGFRPTPDSTHVIDLAQGFDAALSGFHSGQRRAFRRGASAGLVARAASAPEDHAAYAALYERTLAIRGESSTSRYPPAVLAALARQSLEAPDRVLLWLVEHEGALVMGAYGLRWGPHLAMWHAATAGLRLPMASPLVTLLGEMMRSVAADGVTTFDLNPSAGLPGVEDFKRRLGATEVPVVRLTYRSRAGATALAAVNRVDRLRRAVRR